jgi:aminotransferase in exopolysaccharide biosynthesis
MVEYTGAKKAVACVNGTSALYLALKLAGVGPGDEVITQPLTFIATANAITYCGAKPVFLDVDMDTMGLSPQAILKFIKTQTYYNSSSHQLMNSSTHQQISACVPMHTFGHPCRIKEIVEICDLYNMPVVEDSAESLGSFYEKQHTDTFGRIGVLSFNGNKIITTGGGGMLLFQDEELAKRAKHLTTQAKVPHQWEFVHDETGCNYRMPNINAALGLAQIEQLPTFLASKRRIAEKYNKFFSALQLLNHSDFKSNYWLNCILLTNKEEREDFLRYTNEKGIKTRPAWRLMNRLIMFKDCQTDDLINAKNISDRLVNIPSSAI